MRNTVYHGISRVKLEFLIKSIDTQLPSMQEALDVMPSITPRLPKTINTTFIILFIYYNLHRSLKFV